MIFILSLINKLIKKVKLNFHIGNIMAGKNKYMFLIMGILLLGLENCSFKVSGDEQYSIFAQKNLDEVIKQFDILLNNASLADGIPKSMDKDGNITWCNPKWDWVEGFFPGMCWQIYEVSENKNYLKEAEFFQNKIIDHRFYEKSHDLGFVFDCSFGRGYEITGSDSMKQVLIDAANSLISRYDPRVGCIQSWCMEGLTPKNWMFNRGWEFPVIVDNMMNLELLFMVSEITGDPKYRELAIAHADLTIKNHYREDFSSYHVVDYDKETGKIRSKETAQGFAHESAWARGQAWGLYGFTVCYRYTKDKKYLLQAEGIAGFLLENLPDDMIPYWDFNAPNLNEEQKDASAGAIIASALIELDSFSNQDYLDDAYKILEKLASPDYRNKVGTNEGYILNHSVGSIPHGSEVDVPIIYADYYYIEALMRMLQTHKKSINTTN